MIENLRVRLRVMESTQLPYARSFRDLIVYQKQRQLAREVFQTTKSFPADEKFALTDQLRHSSRSVGGQIAGAWAKRRYEKHFISKLTDADGEQMETQHWLESTLNCGYSPREACIRLIASCEEIGHMPGSMMESASFCGDLSAMKEEPSEYFCSLTNSLTAED